MCNIIPTSPNKTQYNAAYIGNGIDAKTAPNFPAGKCQLSEAENDNSWPFSISNVEICT